MSDWGVDVTGWNLLPAVPGALDEVISKAVRKAALDIQAMAQRSLKHGYGLDTGALKASIYTVMAHSSGYASAAGEASGAASSGEHPHPFEMLPEVEKPRNARTAYVAVGASYGIYVEFGTSKMPAKPYLVPAAEFVRPSYIAALSSMEGALLTALGGGGDITVSGGGE